ncbi:MAG: transketolase, partial [Actinobacteria bacterium]|nr:transketolase [Actinomycetota bacterium]
VPGLTLLAPATEPEVAWALDACLTGEGSYYLRLSSIPCIIPFALDSDPLPPGQGRVLIDGSDGVIFSYGPVMLAQAFWASEQLRPEGVSLRIVNLPWLNRVDPTWLRTATESMPWVFTLDDHYVIGGQGDMILARLAELGWPTGARARKLGVTEIPVCGQNHEVLGHHRLDAQSLAEDLLRAMRS